MSFLPLVVLLPLLVFKDRTDFPPSMSLTAHNSVSVQCYSFHEMDSLVETRIESRHRLSPWDGNHAHIGY